MATTSDRQSLFYEQAIERDPNYALAYVGLAEAYVFLPFYTSTAPRECLPESKTAARKRCSWMILWLKRTPWLAFMLFILDVDIAGSITEFQRAIELKSKLRYCAPLVWLLPLIARAGSMKRSQR